MASKHKEDREKLEVTMENMEEYMTQVRCCCCCCCCCSCFNLLLLFLFSSSSSSSSSSSLTPLCVTTNSQVYTCTQLREEIRKNAQLKEKATASLEDEEAEREACSKRSEKLSQRLAQILNVPVRTRKQCNVIEATFNHTEAQLRNAEDTLATINRDIASTRDEAARLEKAIDERNLQIMEAEHTCETLKRQHQHSLKEVGAHKPPVARRQRGRGVEGHDEASVLHARMDSHVHTHTHTRTHTRTHTHTHTLSFRSPVALL